MPENKKLYYRPFANNQLNSRISSVFPEVKWEIKWKSALDPFLPSRFVLLYKDKYLILQGYGWWKLFDLNGELLQAEKLGDSDIVIDEINDMVYSFDGSGFFNAFNIPINNPAIKVFVNGTENRKRIFFAREDDYLLIASLEKAKDPHRITKFLYASCESYLLSNPPEIKNRIWSSSEINSLDSDVTKIVAALNKGNFIYAIKNQIIITDLELNVKNIIERSFWPVSLSLDEKDRIYLLALTEDNTYHLWILSFDGQLILDLNLPEISSNIEIPPIISSKNNILLSATNRIIAFNELGKLLWDSFTTGTIGGIVTTANEFLIVSEGNLLSAFNESGERKPIYNFIDEVLTTPPVLTDNKEIFVATQNNLCCLTPKT